MLIFDRHIIGNRLLLLRKRRGLTQAEVAEAAALSDRAYADIERGSVNMRIETLLKICAVLRITPDEILTDDAESITLRQEELWARMNEHSLKDRETALAILEIFLRSLDR